MVSRRSPVARYPLPAARCLLPAAKAPPPQAMVDKELGENNLGFDPLKYMTWDMVEKGIVARDCLPPELRCRGTTAAKHHRRGAVCASALPAAEAAGRGARAEDKRGQHPSGRRIRNAIRRPIHLICRLQTM
ncbi:unnamed protein product [Boreogadus saida]